MRKSSKPREILEARCAGVCYPTEAESALSYFRNFFDVDQAPSWPKRSKKTPIPRGLVAPHIDFRVSTRSYAWAYNQWLQSTPADVYIILGVGHRAHQEWSVDRRSWRTPLGTVDVHVKHVEALVDVAGKELENDPQAYEGEHSIEFPLVCLQAFRQLSGIKKPFTFVPVLCGGLHEMIWKKEIPGKGDLLEKLADGLGNILKAPSDQIQLIISVDGCHIGPRFQHPFPVSKKILRETGLWEQRLWDAVEQADYNQFFEPLFEEGNARYFDGVGALALTMKALKDDFKFKRVCYEQWFEPSDHSVVSFSSGVIL